MPRRSIAGASCMCMQFAGLNRADQILSEVSAPTPQSVMYHETPSEVNIPSDKISVIPPFHEFTADDYSGF